MLMHFIKNGCDQMEMITTKYKNYYVNVARLMAESLPRPKLKPTILVTGWNEFLPLVTVTTEV